MATFHVNGATLEFPQEELHKAMREMEKLGREVAGPDQQIGFSARYALPVHARHPTKARFLLNAMTQHAARIVRTLVERQIAGGPKAQSAVGRVLMKAAELILGEAIAKAPVKTGFLKRSAYRINKGESVPEVKEEEKREA
jgi:hypothetical protein